MPYAAIPPTPPVSPAPVHCMPPADVDVFLCERGWNLAGFDGITRQPVYAHPNQPSGYFPWYEAVALEMVRFMRIGP